MKTLLQDHNHQRDFWIKESGWPIDTSSHVFLARATQIIGKVLFGAQWTHAECTTEIYRSLPTDPPSSGLDAYFAHNLLMLKDPASNRQPLSFHGPWPPTVSFTREEWAAALGLVKANHDEHRPALTRFRETMARIAAWAAEGKLLTALRPRVGGDFTKLASLAWNTERLDPRFTLCQMSPSDPFSLGIAGDGFCWIYVQRESLNACIRSLAPEMKQTISVENQCQQWLEQQLALTKTETWSKTQFQTAAKEEFGAALGIKMFVRAWDAEVKKPGNEPRRRAGRKRR